MKILFKPAFAVFFALLLASSMHGCSDKEGTSGSQNNGDSSSVPDSGKVKLILKPGLIRIYFDFIGVDDADMKNNQNKVMQIMQQQLENSGVAIKDKDLPTNGSWGAFTFLPLRNELVIHSLNKVSLGSIRLDSQTGIVANWDPFQGNEVKYNSAGSSD